VRKGKLKYSVISLLNGIVKIKKPCGYCEKKHVVEFPVDDLLVKRRMCSLCKICKQQMEEIKKKYPDLRKRRDDEDFEE
jgi:hypothetical protein